LNLELTSAFLLGVAGSLHCAAMCGPLSVLVPVTGPTISQRIASRLTYNVGRLVTYIVLGILFGLFGKAFVIVGLQRWLSIAAGVIILSAFVTSMFNVQHSMFNTRVLSFPLLIKSKFSKLLKKRTLLSIATLGALNGLLPCGLVYVACAAAATTASPLNGATYMLSFGLGTVPMLLTIALAGSSFRLNSFKLQRLIPIVAATVGVLLIVRGLALGIPYVSPASTGHCPACLVKSL
jgi:uncharacterized protein